ncbi:hypothetical protein JJB27_03695 [Campylobacter fetus subsp. venerealis]|uniref:hypothetical protein n=1 Tax=Campylobacter fetus TaxID=196 RepID=UPI000818BE56|nr:hypothetical protein [Campylobacter fetus]MBK3498180.1 hypothetical protein [Campylobacter fetus subsp. venerealis]MBK3502188.1 hypothetical protein [Campylobacter fetus subsp. venerealis]OCS16816.1 hypothetical protein CfvWBT01109_01910 [Campylobacter fetus subsp. venerealis]
MTKDPKRQECINILNRYKDEITEEQYMQNLSIIGNFAIEGIYLDEKDIKNLIRMDKGVNADVLIAELKQELGQRYGSKRIRT